MGANLMQIRVADFMSQPKWTVAASATVQAIDQLMTDRGIRHVPVVQGDKAIGIISDRDLLYHKRLPDWERFTAADIMTPSPYTVNAETPLAEAVNVMAERKINSVMIEGAKGNFIGLLTSTNALKALIDLLKNNPPVIFT